MASTAGNHASIMVLSPRSALPRCCMPSTPAWNAATTSAGCELGLVRGGCSGSEKKRPEERPRAASHGLDEHRRGVLKDRAKIRRRFRGQLGLHRGETAVQTDAEITVADGGIQIGQLLPLFAEERLQRLQPAQHVLLVHGHAQIPHRRAGVSTGSSHSDSSSSSAFNR